MVADIFEVQDVRWILSIVYARSVHVPFRHVLVVNIRYIIQSTYGHLPVVETKIPAEVHYKMVRPDSILRSIDYGKVPHCRRNQVTSPVTPLLESTIMAQAAAYSLSISGLLRV